MILAHIVPSVDCFDVCADKMLSSIDQYNVILLEVVGHLLKKGW